MKIPNDSWRCSDNFRMLLKIPKDVPMISEGSYPVSQAETQHFSVLFRTQTQHLAPFSGPFLVEIELNFSC